MRRYVYPEIGSRRLTQLTPIEVQAVYTKMLELGGFNKKGLSPRTVRYTHAVLHKALGQAVKWRMTGQNVATLIDLPKQRKKEMKALSEEEATRFLAAAKSDKYYVLFALLLGTGLRPGEALGLKWTDFDAAKSSLRVHRVWARGRSGHKFQQPKTAKSRRNVELPEGLVKLLVEHRDQQPPNELDLMFASETGTPLNERNITTRHFKKILKRAGLPENVRLYDLRHTHATLLLIVGTHPKIVSERLGHATVTLTLDTYSHVLPGMQSDSAQRLDAMLFKPDEAQTNLHYN